MRVTVRDHMDGFKVLGYHIQVDGRAVYYVSRVGGQWSLYLGDSAEPESKVSDHPTMQNAIDTGKRNTGIDPCGCMPRA